MLQLKLGLIYTLISNFAFVAVSCLMRFITPEQIYAVQLWTGLVKFAISSAYYLKYNTFDSKVLLSRDHMYVAGCQLISVPGYILLSLAVQNIELGFIMLIQNCGPFIVAIMSYLMLKEKIQSRDLKTIAIAILLVSVIASTKIVDNDQDLNIYQLIVGSIQAFASISLFAFTYIITRYLKHMKSDEQQFSSSMYSFIILAFVFASQEPEIAMLGHTWFIGVLSGVFSFVVSLSFIRANSLISASKVASLDFIQIPLGYMCDLILFGQHITITELVACVGICICGYYVFKEPASISYNDKLLK